jgi:thiamine biosynthesis lipoprotein
MTSSKVARASRPALLLLALTASAASLQRFEAVEPHMGTLVRIELYAPSQAAAAEAFHAAFARIAELDDILSDYKPESELNRLCASPGPVSPDLFTVLQSAQKLAEDTNGAFDVTVGPVTHLWREARKHHRLPDPDALRDAGSRTGYRKLHLDAERRAAALEPGMQLDLGGIAKGYAADEALAAITRLGIRSALVAMSGDLAFSDAPPGRRAWRIEAAGRVLELTNAAVSTSGDDEQHLDLDGRRYSHIVDPATGEPLADSFPVTVIARRGIDADALATALSVLGPERAREFLRTRPEKAILGHALRTQRNSGQ